MLPPKAPRASAGHSQAGFLGGGPSEGIGSLACPPSPAEDRAEGLLAARGGRGGGAGGERARSSS
jgi:hypothetical protein